MPEMKKTEAAAPMAAPHLTDGADVLVIVREVGQTGARVQLLPLPTALERMLTDAFGTFGWECRRYSCGGTLYCSVGVWNPQAMQYVHRDAPAEDDYRYKDKARSAAASSLAHAAAHWGVGADILNLPVLTLTAEQVSIRAVAKADGKTIDHWALEQRLTVDKFMRAEGGAITMVQFDTSDGKKVLWPAQ